MNNETNVLIFCENIKRLRKREKLSKKNMAKMLHIGVKTLTAIESGILPKSLDCSVLFYIDDNFNISASDMLASLIPLEK